MTNNLNLAYGLTKARLPLIPIEIQNKSLCFLLDTGSNINMIDITVYEYFKDIAEPTGEFTHFGIEGNKEQVITIKLPLSCNGCIYIPEFSVVNLDKAFSTVYEESGIPIHGILGNKFFIEHKWILDFNKLELCFGQVNYL